MGLFHPAFYPRIELRKLKSIDFFPPKPPLAQMRRICIGSKTRTIGDALILSTLPRKLKALYPSLTIDTYPRAFNPVVFYGNPHVSGVSYLPGKLYGDDNSEGFGHLIQLKEQCFGVPVSEDPRPELHLTPEEIAWAERYLREHARAPHLPLCLIHPWGHTWQKVAPMEFWEKLTAAWKGRVRFWQIGIEGHREIPGCEHHFLTPRAFYHARKLFALMARADLFVGVNSGPMHVARAFSVPSLILTEEGDLAGIFRRRHEAPYFLRRNWAQAFLYESNRHLDMPSLSLESAVAQVSEFLEASRHASRFRQA